MSGLIFSFPKSLIYFFRFRQKWINKAVRRHLKCLVLAVILLRGNRTLSNVVRLYFETRHKSSLSRCLNQSVMPTFAMLDELQQRLLREAKALPHSKRLVYLIIDSTYERKQAKRMEKYHLSKMGEVSVVFSQKENDRNPSLRYFVTDMLSKTTAEILTIYSYRWQIELFFKELKSYLGFGHYQLLRFPAIMRYVDIVLMSFMYLEHLRIKKLKETPLKKEWLYARTLQMSYVLQQEVSMVNLPWIFSNIKSQKEMEKLERQLQNRMTIFA